MFERPKEAEQGQFDSGLSIIYRIDDIIRRIDTYSAAGDIYNQYRWLNVFFKELSEMMRDTKTEKETISEKQVQIEHRAKVNRILNNASSKAEAAEALDTWELELRRLQHEKGLGMPKRRDPRFALSSGR